jgi:hypothetical protein
MELVPLNDVAERSTGKVALYHALLDRDRDPVLTVVGMKKCAGSWSR